ncbi:DUF397 domain-containing protein [Micromonospora sp. NPDC050397]|uniref:DUF397 domain-containing protein n=1 Tax=Micromonospora sp. NPDC050397 TaxID=3364279 RepID=UPI00384D61B9
MLDKYDALTPEVLAGAHFRKALRSDSSGSCVEVAKNLRSSHNVIVTRDSKDADGPVLAFGPQAWIGFLLGVRRGEFDA